MNLQTDGYKDLTTTSSPLVRRERFADRETATMDLQFQIEALMDLDRMP
ncbi:MAG: hypothetical protein NT070_18930 [Cyanobacteria bacterium]|nr:hypothetical protein [Cyanobacteriota bacterium]